MSDVDEILLFDVQFFDITIGYERGKGRYK
jgi:hypothetical protein